MNCLNHASNCNSVQFIKSAKHTKMMRVPKRNAQEESVGFTEV